MIALLLRAADAYARVRPGHRLAIANIARRGGGPIPWSVSHQNGRDADVLLPVLGPDGAPRALDEMVPLDDDGRATLSDGTVVHLDVDALLAVVTALLDQDEIGVRWLFLANPLREQVLEAARAEARPRRLIARMERTLRQPRGALPHNDHLHLRIACAPADVLEGCRDIRMLPRQFEGALRRFQELALKLREGLRSLGPPALRLALHLAPDSRARRELLVALLRGPLPRMRRAAVDSLPGLAGAAIDAALARWLRRSVPPVDAARALAVVEARPDRRWTETLKVLLQDPRPLPGPFAPGAPRRVLELAAWLAGVTADPRLVVPLARVHDERVEGLVRQALRRITLESPPGSRAQWAAWAKARRPAEIQRRRRDRSRALGFVDRRGHADPVACLLGLSAPEDEVRELARRLLDGSQPRPCRCARYSVEDLQSYWRRRLRNEIRSRRTAPQR